MTDDQKLQRFAHVFQKASGSREMVESEDGEWVRHEEVQEIFYRLELALGNVFHACSNHDDAGEAADLLDPILSQLGALASE